MANHVSHGSLPYPIKNARYTLLVPYLDADGDPTDPTTPDTELSGDAGAFADCAEEVSTITGSNGTGYLTLSGAEMNYSLVALAAKVASGPKATLATLYPRNLPVLASGTLSAGSAGGGTLGTLLEYNLTNCFIRTTGGTGGGGTGGANNQARRIATYDVTTGAFTVTPNWETTPDGTTTYDILLPEGITPGMVKTLHADIPEVVADDGAVQANVVQVGSLSTLVGIWLNTFMQGSISAATLNTVTVSALINGNDVDFSTKTSDSFKDFMLMVIDSDNVQARQVTAWDGATNTFTVFPDFDDTPLTEECYLMPGPAIPLLFDKTLAYAQLLARNDADIATDRATELAEINADEGSGGGSYDNTDEALQGLGTTLGTMSANLAAQINRLIYSSVILETTVDNASSNTVFELTGGSTDDDVFVNHFVVLQQVGTPANRMVGKISAYSGATREVTLFEDPGLYTVSAGDTVYVLSWRAEEIVNANVQQLYGDDFAAAKLSAWMQACDFGTCQTGSTSTTIKLGLLASSEDNFYKGLVYLYGGTGIGQARMLSGVYDGTTKVADLAEGESWTVTPDNTSYYLFIPFAALDAVGVRDAVGLAAADLDTQLGTLDTVVHAIQVDTGTDIPGLIAALENLSAAEVATEIGDALHTDVLPDVVAADGSRPTIAQALLMITRFLTERSVTSTTLTVYKEDGTTASMTFTLNDATTPTALTRAS